MFFFLEWSYFGESLFAFISMVIRCLIFSIFSLFLNELELKYFLYPLNIIIREYTSNISCPFASFLKLKKEDLNSIYRFIEILEAGTILRIEIRIV